MAAGLLAETAPAHVPRTCDHCGAPLAERARVDARFCRATCRVAQAAIDRKVGEGPLVTAGAAQAV